MSLKVLEVYPNPFHARTKIYGTNAQVGIYSLSGRLVGRTNNSIWNGRDSDGKEVQSGIYFLKAKGYNPVKIMKLR